MSNFQCPHCGMVNIDCGKKGFKTPEELKYESILFDIREIINSKNSFEQTKTEIKEKLKWAFGDD